MNTLRSCAKTFILSKAARLTDCDGHRYIKRWVAPTQKEITKRKRNLPPQPVPKRSTFLEWNRAAEIYAFNKRLSESFDIQQLEQAFTHRSYIIQEQQRQREIGIEDPKLDIKDNYDLIISGEKLTCETLHNYLVDALPNASEDVITSLQDYLMSEEVLAKAAFHIGVKDIVLTEEHPVAQKTLADTFLALTAALAHSVSVKHAENFIKDFLIVILAEKDLTEIWNPSRPVERLNNILRQRNRSPVEPRLIAQAGRNTLLVAYHVGMYSDKHFLGSGFGQTIEEAKDVAAINTLSRIFGLLDSSNPMKFNKTVNVSSGIKHTGCDNVES